MKTLHDPQTYTPFSSNLLAAAERAAKAGSALQHEAAGGVLLGCLREALDAGKGARIEQALAEAMAAPYSDGSVRITLGSPRLLRTKPESRALTQRAQRRGKKGRRGIPERMTTGDKKSAEKPKLVPDFFPFGFSRFSAPLRRDFLFR